MEYRERIQVLVLVSLALHVAFLFSLPLLPDAKPRIPKPDLGKLPLVLSFRQHEPDEPPQFIDPGAEATDEVDETNLKTDRDTQAQGMSPGEGDPSRPNVDKLDELDQLGTAPAPPPAPGIEAPPVEAQRPQPPVEAAEELAAPEPSPAETEPRETAMAKVVETAPSVEEPEAPLPPEESEADSPEPEAESKPEEEAQETPERFEVAQAPQQPQPVVEPQEVRMSHARESGGAEKSGFTSFEANKHELGEYMITVRNRVEREWRTGLHLRYLGSSRAAARIECSIRPDGTLEYARVRDPGSSLSFAIVCRDAIEKAAPFGPFPFDVPAIYREQNLEIVWRFSYL